MINWQHHLHSGHIWCTGCLSTLIVEIPLCGVHSQAVVHHCDVDDIALLCGVNDQAVVNHCVMYDITLLYGVHSQAVVHRCDVDDIACVV